MIMCYMSYRHLPDPLTPHITVPLWGNDISINESTPAIQLGTRCSTFDSTSHDDSSPQHLKVRFSFIGQRFLSISQGFIGLSIQWLKLFFSWLSTDTRLINRRTSLHSFILWQRPYTPRHSTSTWWHLFWTSSPPRLEKGSSTSIVYSCLTPDQWTCVIRMDNWFRCFELLFHLWTSEAPCHANRRSCDSRSLAFFFRRIFRLRI